MQLDHITPADLAELGHLLPSNGADLVRCIGVPAALALLNGLPGAVMVMPKAEAPAHRCGPSRWAMLQSVVGPGAMPALAAQYGGAVLDVPVCHQLRTERRNRWLRARFDALTSPHGPHGPHDPHSPPGAGCMRSKAQAVYELGLELAARGQVMSSRGIEGVIDSAGPSAAASRDAQRGALQPELF